MEKTVKPYSKVKVRVNNCEQIFVLVNSHEIDIANNKISIDSPLGKALLSRKIEEEISVNIPKGTIKYKIIAIE